MTTIALLVALTVGEAIAQQRVPGQSREMRQAVRMLTSEAREVRASGLPDEALPDFAARFEGHLTTETVQQAMVTAQHRDPFTDAYIRWQLLSFEPTFPELDDRAFLRLLTTLPAFIENPRAEQSFMELVARAEQIDALSQADFERLQQLDEQRTQQMHEAERLNQPATALRQWIRAGVHDEPLRALQSMIEECGAIIDGAWPPRAIKTELTQSFTNAARSLHDEQKRIIAQQTSGLIGKDRRFVNAITYFADRSINVSYSRARVSQSDYNRWMQRLTGS